MAEISLREYLAKLDTLLKSGSAAEVILHCRHILQYFPKNAQAYRLLGQALVATSRWQEAGEVMRRVLSVFPDDRDAHAGLSEVYRIEKRPDDSIWHLERAFEQTPNDQTILDNLRELYRKFHKVEHGKVQLTSAAVARQYIRNGLYEQAIDALQKARTASPERIDIPLLLAQTYWDRGQQIEAAEMALEVLRVLPDCLVANTLLAAMWLTESRPSDAQRYIGRIESLDPYLALELAQGQEVPDNAFKLSELDYQRAAEREMSLQTPDWLDMTGNNEVQAPAEENSDEVPDFFSEITPDDVIAKQSFDVPLTSADWATTSNDTPYVDNEPTVRKSTGGLTGLSGRLNKPPTGSLPSVPGPKRGLTGHLTPIPEQMPQPEPTPSDELPTFIQDVVPSSDEVAAPPQTTTSYTSDLPDLESLVPGTPDSEDLPFRRERTIQPEDNDPLAWLRSSGVEINEETQAPVDDDIFDAEFDSAALSEADAADPLSWLQGYGGNDLVVDQPQTTGTSFKGTDDLPVPEDQAGDPLAWLQSSEPAAAFPPSAPASSLSNNEDDPLDWLSDDSLLDEAFDLESLVNNQPSMPEQPSEQAVSSMAATPDWQDTMADEKDPLDWLSSEPEPEAEPSDSFTWMDDAQAASAAPNEEFPDWLNASASNSEVIDASVTSPGDDMNWMTDLPDLVASEAAEPPKPTNTGMLDWLGKEKTDVPVSNMPSMEQPDVSVPDWLGELNTGTPSEPAASRVDENGFEWMSMAEELPPVPSASDFPDWLSEAGVGTEVEPSAADVPDWLSAVDNTPEPAAANQPHIVADTPDWLSSVDADEEPAVQSLGYADTPDWLSSTSASPEADDEPLGIADTPDWLSSVDADEEPTVQSLGYADTPDWLSSTSASPEPAQPDEPHIIADTPDWLSSIDDAEQQPAEPMVAADTPDWLSELKTDEEPARNVPDWMSRAEPKATTDALLKAANIHEWASGLTEDEEQPAEPLPAADAPAWLSELQPEEAEPQSEPAPSADIPDWLSSMDIGDEQEAQPEPMASDAPDWLSSLQPDEPEQEPEPLAAADAPDWLSDLQPEEPEQEPEPLAAADAPDWLAAMKPAEEEEPEAEPIAAADTPDWLSAMQPEELEQEPEAEPIAAADTPDWLSAMQPEDTEAEPEAEPIAAADTPDWLSAMQPEEPEQEPEAEPIAAADTPDWLSAMQPADQEEPEAEPIAAADTPDWLSAMQPEDTEAEPEAEPIAVADTLDWLSAMQPADQEEPEAEPIAAADTPDWLSAMQPESEQPEAEPVTDVIPDDTPDWLTAMQQPTEPVVASERVPTGSMTDLLNSMPTEPVPDAEQPLNDEEWTEAAELEPETTAESPDWLAAMNTTAVTEPSNDESKETFEWDDAPAEESMPAAPAPASNAPDWLNAMVPGLDVDYDAPEDEPVETEFLPTNKRKSAPSAPAKETKVRPEFGWLLDIVDEESQQVTVVADKNALRRFVFSHRPSWLRKPTEQPDKSPSSESEADNVDIPPWLQ